MQNEKVGGKKSMGVCLQLYKYFMCPVTRIHSGCVKDHGFMSSFLVPFSNLQIL